MIFIVGYVFYFGYSFYRLVVLAFSGLFGFSNIFIFLLLSLFESASSRKVLFLSSFITLWFSGWAFVVRFPICCIATSAISFFWSLFPSCSVFSSTQYFMLGFFVDCLLSVGFQSFGCSDHFFLSYVLCCICSITLGTSKYFSFNSLLRGFLSVIDVIILIEVTWC